MVTVAVRVEFAVATAVTVAVGVRMRVSVTCTGCQLGCPKGLEEWEVYRSRGGVSIGRRVHGGRA